MANVADSLRQSRSDNKAFRLEQIGKRWTIGYYPSHNLAQRLNGPPIIPISVLGPALSQLPARKLINSKDRFRQLLALAANYVGVHYKEIKRYHKAKRILTDLIAESKKNQTTTQSQQQQQQQEGTAESDTATNSDASNLYSSTSVAMLSTARISGFSLNEIIDPLYNQVESNHRGKTKKIS